MNKDIFLNFFYILIKKGYLREKTQIKEFFKNNKIEKKLIRKEQINTPIFICKAVIDKEKILLIEDLPLNFMISHTILLGDKTELYEFEIENQEMKYIASKKVLDRIKYNFMINNIKKISPRELYNKKYRYYFELPKIVQNVKEYISNVKNLSFGRVHVVRGDTIENFIPTVKSQHFKLAEKMGLPLIPLLDHNFIKESIINIHDLNKMQELINPFLVYEKKISWDVLKENGLRVYKDISREYHIEFDKEAIIEKILNCKIVNFDKQKVIAEIKNMASIEISVTHGKYPLPIWKSRLDQKYVEIENSTEFLNISGVRFEIKDELFQNLYLQALSGEKALYKSKYIQKDLELSLESMEKSEKVVFRNSLDLVFKLIYNLQTDVEEMILEERINEDRIEVLKKDIDFLLGKVIEKSVAFNKLPTFERERELFGKYLLSSSKSIFHEIEKFVKYPSKKNLLNRVNKKTEHIIKSIKNYELEFNHLYPTLQLILILIEVLKIYDEEYGINKENEFKSYFKNIVFKPENAKIDENAENLFKDLIILYEISRRNEVFLIKKQDLDKQYIENIKVLKNICPKAKYVKPNIKKIKDVFKYSYLEVITKIQELKPEELDKRVIINIKERNMVITEDFYRIHYEYENYRQALENEWFVGLVKK